jgi:hypothetical protein
MANGPRGSMADPRRYAVTGTSLRMDPSLPRTLVNLVFATGDAGTARRPRRRATAASRRPLPRRLPIAISNEIAPNVLYRRYPLVTSLLVELDQLRRDGSVPPRRGR